MVIVLMTSLIATVSTMAIAMQAHTSYVNSSRQSMAKRAREAAESGLAILVESLNQDYPEWLVSDYNGEGLWSAKRTEAQAAEPTSLGAPPPAATAANRSMAAKGTTG